MIFNTQDAIWCATECAQYPQGSTQQKRYACRRAQKKRHKNSLRQFRYSFRQSQASVCVFECYRMFFIVPKYDNTQSTNTYIVCV